MTQKGYFISFEGGEGAGKGTQVSRLLHKLEDYFKGNPSIVTVRDPGGTPDSEKIRNLLVQREGGNWVPKVEMLLYFAARVQLTEEIIMPALQSGSVVISDRYADSTRAYQSYGRGHSMDTLETIKQAVLGDFEPDLTFILDLPADLGLERSHRAMQMSLDLFRRTEDRFERIGIAFHERVRKGYLEIANANPGRCVVIDATQDVDKVAEDVWKIVEQRVIARG